jgi:hypothetical protein
MGSNVPRFDYVVRSGDSLSRILINQGVTESPAQAGRLAESIARDSELPVYDSQDWARLTGQDPAKMVEAMGSRHGTKAPQVKFVPLRNGMRVISDGETIHVFSKKAVMGGTDQSRTDKAKGSFEHFLSGAELLAKSNDAEKMHEYLNRAKTYANMAGIDFEVAPKFKRVYRNSYIGHILSALRSAKGGSAFGVFDEILLARVNASRAGIKFDLTPEQRETFKIAYGEELTKAENAAREGDAPGVIKHLGHAKQYSDCGVVVRDYSRRYRIADQAKHLFAESVALDILP